VGVRRLTPPDRICRYRYRSLDAELVDREMAALNDADLFDPPFNALYRPMEDF
jgi:hypothetical protein